MTCMTCMMNQNLPSYPKIDNKFCRSWHCVLYFMTFCGTIQRAKMYKTPVHVPTSVLRKCHPQSLLQVVTSKTGRMMATSKFKEGVVFLGPCHQYPSFFLDDTASTKYSLASQRHSSLCLIQQNIAELPRRAEAEAMCDQKKNTAFDRFGETLFMMADD